uniref:Uncharacterized protein n=1 Tax=Aegilops tauschii TaxID=37682 RepID=N1QVS1_AEGTA
MAMRGNIVKTLALMLVVVGLVALQQTQQVQASHCCCHLDSVPTYFKCREKSDSTVSECCGASDGYVSDAAGFECKSGYIDIETALQGVTNVVVGKGSYEVNQSMGGQLVFQPSPMCRDENGVEVSAFPEKKEMERKYENRNRNLQI